MQKVIYVFILFCLLMFSGYISTAQQRPVLSQYMFSGMALNPAYAGRHQYTDFTAMYRDQWVNIPGSPITSTFIAQSGFKDRNLGIGLLVSNDKVGVHSNTMVYGTYAYVVELGNGAKLSMGLQAGIDHLSSDWSKLNLPPGSQNDPLFNGSETNIYPNFGSGLFYFTDKFYLGASVPYILSNQKSKAGDMFIDVRHSRNYYLTGGVLIELGPKWVFKPSALLRLEDNMPVAFDLNANIYFNEVIEFGVSYRQGDAIIGILGIQINKYVKFSYAYDYIISDLGLYTKGSHELMVQYRINFYAPKKHRMCPGPNYF